MFHSEVTPLLTLSIRIQGKDVGDEGISRPSVTDESIKTFLKAFSEQCHITHDAFLGEDRDRTFRTEDVSVAERVAPEGYVDYKKKPTIEPMESEFWDLRKKMATVSAPVMHYADSAELLGIDPDHKNIESIQLFPPGHPKDPEDAARFVPKPHQVIGTAWQYTMEKGPVKGGILALDCGLGKTSEQYFLIYASAMRQLRAHRKYCRQVAVAAEQGLPAPEEKPFDFRPTYVLAPPSTLDSWFTEYKKHWVTAQTKTPLVQLRVFYGSDRTLSIDVNEDLRLLLLPASARDARIEIEKSFPPDDPMSAFGVVWCAYETNTARTLTTVKKGDEVKFLQNLSINSVNKG